MEILNPIKK